MSIFNRRKTEIERLEREAEEARTAIRELEDMNDLLTCKIGAVRRIIQSGPKSAASGIDPAPLAMSIKARLDSARPIHPADTFEFSTDTHMRFAPTNLVALLRDLRLLCDYVASEGRR